MSGDSGQWFQVSNVSLGLGEAGGQPSFRPVTFTLGSDAGVLNVDRNLFSGEVLTSVEVAAYGNVSGQAALVEDDVFTKVLASQQDSNLTGSSQQMQMSLQYQRVAESYVPYDGSGNAQTPVGTAWDANTLTGSALTAIPGAATASETNLPGGVDTASSSQPFDYFVRFGTVTGDNNSQWIAVQGIDFGFTNQGAGITTFAPLKLTLGPNAVLPKLDLQMLQSHSLQVEIAGYEQLSGNPAPTLVDDYSFGSATLSQDITANATGAQQLTLQYSKVQESHDGTTTAWDASTQTNAYSAAVTAPSVEPTGTGAVSLTYFVRFAPSAGVTGDSGQWFQVSNVSLGLGETGGKPSFRPVTFTLGSDAGVLNVDRNLFSGEVLTSVEVAAYGNVSGQAVLVEDDVFTNVLASQQDSNLTGSSQQMQMSLHYQKVAESYVPYDGSGNAQTPVGTAWDANTDTGSALTALPGAATSSETNLPGGVDGASSSQPFDYFVRFGTVTGDNNSQWIAVQGIDFGFTNQGAGITTFAPLKLTLGPNAVLPKLDLQMLQSHSLQVEIAGYEQLSGNPAPTLVDDYSFGSATLSQDITANATGAQQLTLQYSKVQESHDGTTTAWDASTQTNAYSAAVTAPSVEPTGTGAVALTYFVRFQPSPGSFVSGDSGQWFQVSNVSLGLGEAGGKPSFSPLTFTLGSDAGVLHVDGNLLAGKTLVSVEVAAYGDVSGQATLVEDDVFTNVVASQQDSSLTGSSQQMQMSLHYQKVAESYVPYDGSGNAQTPVGTAWDANTDTGSALTALPGAATSSETNLPGGVDGASSSQPFDYFVRFGTVTGDNNSQWIAVQGIDFGFTNPGGGAGPTTFAPLKLTLHPNEVLPKLDLQMLQSHSLQVEIAGYEQLSGNPAPTLVDDYSFGSATLSQDTTADATGAQQLTLQYGQIQESHDGVTTAWDSLTDTNGYSAAITAPSVEPTGTGAVALAAQAVLTAATEGVALASSTTVATFTDSNNTDLASGFTATINWGDGTSSTGTVSGANGSFSVDGGHTYAEEGKYTVGVAITDIGGSTASTTGTATVADAALAAAGLNVTATEGASTGATTVASFTDVNANAVASDFTATINWGDGTTSVGTVAADNGGGFSVNGAHSYAEEGKYTVGVAITDIGGSTTSATGTATVADAILTAAGVNVTATEGASTGAATVASFTDANPNAVASDFTAAINWGDGTTSVGTVAANNGGGFSVNGAHSFADEGKYTVGVAITDIGGSTTSATGTATVADAALAAAGVNVTASEGASTGAATVASFTDANPNAVASDFTATINWGDGTTSVGTVAANNGGGFSVNGAHSFADEGKYTVGVATTDIGGSTTSATSVATVTEPPTVQAIVAAPPSGDLGPGKTVVFTVTMSQAVTLAGLTLSTTPYLALNDGGKAIYQGGSGTGVLTFKYTVGALNSGQNTPAIAVSGFSPNGASVYESGFPAIAADLSGVTAFTGGPQIDTTAPAVTEHLFWDTGISSTDGITSNDTLTGSGDPTAVVTLTEGGTPIGTTTANATGAWTFTPTGLAQGVNTIVASETDGAGNTGTASLTFTLETTAPKVTSIAANPANGDLAAGRTVTLTVTFDSPVLTTATLIGKPYLLLNDGGRATYASGSGTNTLTFTYVVAAGQSTPNLAVTGFSPGLINAVGLAPLLAGAVTNPGGTLAINPPVVTHVLTSPASGEVTTGQAVSITVDTSTPAMVTGTPELLLSDGGIAGYDAVHSTAQALVFDYTPAAVDVTTNLTVSGIELPTGSAIADQKGNIAVMSGAAGNLGLQVNTANTGPAGTPGGSFAITGNSEVELFGASAASMTFAPGSAGTLLLDHSSTFAGTVAGLALGNYLDLSDIAYKSNATPAYQSTGANTGTLTVSEGAIFVSIALLGSYMASSFVASSDGHGGTLVTDPPPSQQSLLAQPHA